MAEIPIQEKHRRSMLPLIIGALLVLGLLWWLMSRRGDNDDRDTVRTDTAVVAPATTVPPTDTVITTPAGTATSGTATP